MPLTHYAERPLALRPGYNQRSWGQLARRPGGKAVVFIHGYNGDPLTTWAQFHKLIPQTPEFAECDFFFYGHDGLRGNTLASTVLFYQFLHQLFTQPATITTPILPAAAARAPDFAYSRVVLSAHSLGAVICRWALLHAREHALQGEPHHDWMDNTAMVLFAPAHMGATVSALITELGLGGGMFSTFFRIIGVGIQYHFPLINELGRDKNGRLSAVLQNFHDETNRALLQGSCAYLRASKVVIADRDRVVHNIPFPSDPPAVTFPGDHRSVCKPRSPDFLEPIDVLSNIL
jgi:hypothetical protein